jgi:hypothetical protein
MHAVAPLRAGAAVDRKTLRLMAVPALWPRPERVNSKP